jgi:hypothetical protein
MLICSKKSRHSFIFEIFTFIKVAFEIKKLNSKIKKHHQTALLVIFIVNNSVSLPFCLFVSMYICLCISVSVSLYLPSISPKPNLICQPVCLFTCLPACLPTLPHLSLFRLCLCWTSAFI